MALLMPHTSNTVRSIPPGRRNVILTLYVLLIWFVLALLGSLLGIFVQPPGIASLPTYLAAFTPAILFVAAYLLSGAFRQLVCTLIGDPLGPCGHSNLSRAWHSVRDRGFPPRLTSDVRVACWLG